VDGVAPRAKMNQQRSRRFRSSREAEELAATILARDGKLPEGKKFDSNCITPGTDFMLKLSLAMKKWIEFKQKTDPFWKNGADVVFTGPDVPGEGEHKVMDYIRECKAQYDPEDESKCHPHWKPGMTHILYGLDADLIMLGLVTHEPNFMLLREKMSVVMAGRGRHKHRKKKDMLEYTRDDFELLELKILRQMFQIQFRKVRMYDDMMLSFTIQMQKGTVLTCSFSIPLISLLIANPLETSMIRNVSLMTLYLCACSWEMTF
jgi:5'-3' exoribonuclease 1